MKLALLAMLPLILPVGAAADAQQRPRTAAPATTTATITVTDQSGAPLSDVRVNLTGALDRSGTTQTDGTVKFDGLRPGTYRLRFSREGYVLFERELDVRAGGPAPNPSVALTPAPEPPAPPPEPEPAVTLPPPGDPLTLHLPDFIEKNFIAGNQPQKASPLGCSGLASAVLWQVREPWEGRQHEDAEAMLYVVGGEGTLRLGGRESPMVAGTFAQVPRGTSYSIARRGRNPVILLSVLVGEPCR